MFPQIQPNNWSCLPTAFAIVMDCTVDSLIEEIGHDGSEIWFPNKPDPQNRRSFHPQEIIDAGLRLDSIKIIVEIDPDPAVHPNNPIHIKPVFNKHQAQKRVQGYLDEYPCVLTGRLKNMSRHAVAWNPANKQIIDPKGKNLILEDFIIEDMFLVLKNQID